MNTYSSLWNRPPPASRLGPGLAWALLAVAALGLLLAFSQVVQGGVRQAKLQRQASAAHQDALWRCSTLVGASRLGCLQQARPLQPGAATLEPRTALQAAGG